MTVKVSPNYLVELTKQTKPFVFHVKIKAQKLIVKAEIDLLLLSIIAILISIMSFYIANF